MMKTGDCVIKHPGVFTTGLKLVVSDIFMCFVSCTYKVMKAVSFYMKLSVFV